MGYATKVQLIQREASEQWYVNFPAALAQAMEFSKGEVVEWIVLQEHQVRCRADRDRSERWRVPQLLLNKSSRISGRRCQRIEVAEPCSRQSLHFGDE